MELDCISSRSLPFYVYFDSLVLKFLSICMSNVLKRIKKFQNFINRGSYMSGHLIISDLSNELCNFSILQAFGEQNTAITQQV